MIQELKKAAPFKFKGTISQFPLKAVINYISFTCILSLKKNGKTGALFFKNGNLVGARSGSEFSIHKADELLSWKEGSFYYQKIEKEFNSESDCLTDILYLTELTDMNASITIQSNNQKTEIYCSEGVIVNIDPLPKNLRNFFQNLDSIKDS